jgi:CheY-like chemotaxis protein
MGLATAYGIVENHGGTIAIESSVGQGTTVKITLPSTDEDVAGTKEEKATSRGCAGLVLVIDDEPLVRRSLERALVALGYEVIAAASGEEGVAVFIERHDTIDLVLLDVIMPGLSGGECFTRLRATDSSVPVIVISGYSRDGAVQRILDDGAVDFIAKPIDIDELSRRLQLVLHGECSPNERATK